MRADKGRFRDCFWQGRGKVLLSCFCRFSLLFPFFSGDSRLAWTSGKKWWVGFFLGRLGGKVTLCASYFAFTFAGLVIVWLVRLWLRRSVVLSSPIRVEIEPVFCSPACLFVVPRWPALFCHCVFFWLLVFVRRDSSKTEGKKQDQREDYGSPSLIVT